MSDGQKLTGVGSALRALRESCNLSLNQLADGLGWDKSRLSKYENDERGISTDTLEEIALALGKRPEQVFLYCLKSRYPKLKSSEIGRLLDEIIEEVEG